MERRNLPPEYKKLFKAKDKSKAFDKIAEIYYNKNFGRMSKADFDVLMFSIYLERILDENQEDDSRYSDYTLAKELGITQSRVRSLKEKKELQYPYEPFNWKESFRRVCEKARYENGKFIIEVRDRNLYLEVKNHIEEHNGYVENALSGTLLKVSPEFYIQLLAEIFGNEKTISDIKKELRKLVDAKPFEDDIPLTDLLKNSVPKIGEEILVGVINHFVPTAGDLMLAAVKKLIKSKLGETKK